MRTWRVIECHLQRAAIQVDMTICIAVAAILFSAGVFIGFLAGVMVGEWIW